MRSRPWRSQPGGNDVLIVTYHAIAAPASPVCCPPDQFEADLTGLAAAGFTFVSLDDCADWLAGTRLLPARSVALTFDDAYASVVSTALPLLVRFGVAATIFVISERLGGDNQWPGQWRSIAPMRLANLAELKEAIAAGATIGSHSWSHRNLPDIDAQSLRTEIEDSGDRLEQLLETSVRHFAYPYGARRSREIAAVRRRYRTGVNAEPRAVTSASDPHDLSRLDHHDLPLALRVQRFGDTPLGPYLAGRRALRRARRRVETFFDRS